MIRRDPGASRGRRVATTLGALIAGIYAAIPGPGEVRVGRTVLVLAALPRRVRLSRRIRLVEQPTGASAGAGRRR